MLDTEKRLQRAAIEEHLRRYQYRHLKSEFDRLVATSSSVPFDLWLWLNNLIARPYSDPVFFTIESSPPNYWDDVLLSSKNIANEERSHVAKSESAIGEIWQQELKPEVEELTLRVRSGENKVILRRARMGQYGTVSIPINKGDYDFLKGQLSEETSKEADTYIEIYYLRYSMIASSIYPMTLPDGYYQALAGLGVKKQLFATPLDHQFETYGSEYYDIDRYFGSFGSVLKDEAAAAELGKGGLFEVNIIHYSQLHSLIIARLNSLLKKATKKITLFIVYDLSVDDNEYTDLPTYVYNATFLRRTLPLERRPQGPQGKGLASQERHATNTRNFLVLKSETATAPSQDSLTSLYKELESEGAASDATQHRFTMPILTRFEKARAIATRAADLALKGAKPEIDVPEGVLDVLLVAEMELEQKKMPIVIRRPDGDWSVNELIDYDSGNYRYDQAK